ncbi:MAG: hypothetical protein IKP24_04640 [Alphaproteobacteria bacterium]|nr:hypothetical protein [Alphaproteobacteria bacterium]
MAYEYNNYEDENHQFSTILSIDDSGVWLENDLWGRFFTKRFDGSIYWDGWRQKHKPGDVIPVLRQKRGNTCVYMTGFDLHKTEEKLIDYINRPQQEAFVKAVVYQDNNTYIDCWSPVWKKIEFQEPGYFSAKRGDTLIIERKVIAQDNVSVTYKFNLVRNKTLEDEQTAWINKTLSGFTDAERNKLLLLSDDMRMNKK